METLDQYYSVNGKMISTFREIDTVVEKSRIEVLISSNALQNVMNSKTISNCPSEHHCENAIVDNDCLKNNYGLSKMNQILNPHSENKKICILKYLELGGKMDPATIKIINNSFYLLNTKSNQNNISSSNSSDQKMATNSQYSELDTNLLNEQRFMHEKNFWFKIFYYFQNKYRFPFEKHTYIKKILSDYPNVHERLKHFGYSLLLLENEIVDTYGFKLLQEIYERQKIDFEKSKLQGYMAMEFLSSNVAEYIIKACNENSCNSPKQRMNYTEEFKYI